MHTMEYYLSIKENEIILFAGKWMELEIIILTKVSQAQKDRLLLFPHIWKLHPRYKCTHKHTHTYI
jgi:hypothetical protein